MYQHFHLLGIPGADIEVVAGVYLNAIGELDLKAIFYRLAGEVLDCKALLFHLLALGFVKHAKRVTAWDYKGLDFNGLVDSDAACPLGVVGIGSAGIWVYQLYRRIHQSGLNIIYAPVRVGFHQEGSSSGHVGR